MTDDDNNEQGPGFSVSISEILDKLNAAHAEVVQAKFTEQPEPQPTAEDGQVVIPELGDWMHTSPGEPVTSTTTEEGQKILFGINLIEAKSAAESQAVQTKPTIPSAPVRCACLGCRDRRKKEHRAKQVAAQIQAKEELRRKQESNPTCKFYAPPGVQEGNLPKNFPFNRAVPQVGLCGSVLIAGPAKFNAFQGCGMTDNQSSCPGYEPSDWDTLNQAEVTAADGVDKTVAVRRSRFGISTRWVYEVILEDAEGGNVLHRVDSEDHGEDSQETAQQLLAMELANFEATGFSTKEKPVEPEKHPSYLAVVTVD